MPGNDLHGGFASHFLGPARFFCAVPPELYDGEITDLAAVADAVSTAYEAVVRAEVGEGDLAIVVGVGGVGTFAVQIARARGARVVGIDVDERRLAAVAEWTELSVHAENLEPRDLKKILSTFETERGIPYYGRKIFECSGSAGGQQTAFALINPDATLAVVGFTRERISLRLSNLMALDARVFGNWGCRPDRYPEILELIREGKIVLGPHVERFPMSRLNELICEERHLRRPILMPDFEEISC
jgi:6-hydroxycyclohex-1-ene-1-carbonyl-CoA dehydrogenase